MMRERERVRKGKGKNIVEDVLSLKIKEGSIFNSTLSLSFSVYVATHHRVLLNKRRK